MRVAPYSLFQIVRVYIGDNLYGKITLGPGRLVWLGPRLLTLPGAS